MRGENVFSKLYLHKLGEPQSADTLIYERPDQKQWMFFPQVTDDEQVPADRRGCGRLRKESALLPGSSCGRTTLWNESTLDAAYTPLGNEGSVLYVQTTDKAPRGKIVAIDLSHPQRENWREVVAQQAEAIDAARMVRGRLVISYLKDAASQIKVYGLDGRLVRETPLPGIGKVAFLPAGRGPGCSLHLEPIPRRGQFTGWSRAARRPSCARAG